jgi:hypothetical protein
LFQTELSPFLCGSYRLFAFFAKEPLSRINNLQTLFSRNSTPETFVFSNLQTLLCKRGVWGYPVQGRADTEDSIERLVPEGLPENQSEALRRRNEFAITETELKLMAALAIIGLSSQWNTG